MPGASFLFSAVFRFRKVTQEIFLELDETKNLAIYFTVMYTDTEGETGGLWSPHTTSRHGPPPARQLVVWGPQGSPGVRPSPI